MNKCVLHLVSGDNMFLNKYILGLELRPASRWAEKQFERTMNCSLNPIERAFLELGLEVRG